MVPPPTQGEDLRPLSNNDIAAKAFQDTLLNRRTPKTEKQQTDLRASGMISVDFVDGDPLKVNITVDPSLIIKLAQPWEKALIVKVLGRDIGYIALQKRFMELWKPMGDLVMIELDHGFYVVKFADDSDRDRVVTGGPWLIHGNYLTIQRWYPSFVPSNAEVDKSMVWVRFPELPLLYYHEDVLLAIASSLGEPVKVAVASKGRFVRVCIEIDLLKPLVTQFGLNGKVQRLVYEDVHVASTYCEQYRHLKQNWI